MRFRRRFISQKKVLLTSIIIITAGGLIGGLTRALFYSGGVGSLSGNNIQLASGEKGLVGWWKFDGNAKDSSPNANNGTVNGAILTTDRRGTTNSAYLFNGTSDYIQLTQHNGLPIYSTTQPYSVAMWVKGSGAQSDKRVFSEGSSTSNNPLFNLGTDLNGANNKLAVFIRNLAGSGGISHLDSASDVFDNTWHHIVWTDSAGTAKLYVDGVQDATNFNYTPSAMGTLDRDSIGAILRASVSNNFAGSIDDVRVYNRVLSATDASNLYHSYNSQISVSTLQQSLLGYWPLNGNAKDFTPYSDNGTVTGATLTTDREGMSNKAYSFSGSSSNITTPALAGGGLSTANITFTAWIYPTQMPQPAYAGIIFSRASTQPIGMDFDTNGQNLVYDWNNNDVNTYHWASGLVPTANKWSLVAITISPTAVVGYLGSGTTLISAIHTYAHISQSLDGAFQLGNDSFNTSRGFKGKIDDARIYNRTLNSTEIQALFKEYN